MKKILNGLMILAFIAGIGILPVERAGAQSAARCVGAWIQFGLACMG